MFGIQKVLKKSSDYFFFMRPVLFFPAWTTILIVAGVEGGIYQFTDLFIRFLISGALMGSAFIVNQWCDIESDKINNKCHFLHRKIISVNEAKVLALVLFIIGIGLSVTHSLFMTIVSLSFYTVTSIIYNLHPFRWKQFPLRGAMANFLMGFFVSFYGLPEYSHSALPLLCSLSVFNFFLYVLTTLPDMKGDKQTNKQTISIFLGVDSTKRMMVGLLGIVFLFAPILELQILCGLAFTFFYILELQVELVIKTLLLTMALWASSFFPIYLFFCVIMYIGGRLYYRIRLNLTYPQIYHE